MKTKNLIILSILLFSSTFLLFTNANAQSSIEKKVKKISLLDRLQQEEEIIPFEIITNIETVYADWKVQNYHWGKTIINLSDESLIEEETKVKPRGKYRSRYCDNPPLKIKFSNKKLKARNFKKLNEFKLVYPCKSNEKYQNYVLREYLSYKLYNVLTDKSLRVQLVDLTLRDSTKNKRIKEFKGFLIEHREEFIDRIDGLMSEVKCMRPDHLDPQAYTLFQVFQFFIGNTDWLLPTCKNAEVISLKDGAMIPVPYDFDFSGLVGAEYATADPALGIQSVKTRYFLGHMKSMEELDPVLALFKERKAKLLSVVEEFEYLSKNERVDMTNYLKRFYKILDKPKKVKKLFVHPMGKNMAKNY